MTARAVDDRFSLRFAGQLGGTVAAPFGVVLTATSLVATTGAAVPLLLEATASLITVNRRPVA